ncbi:unnamed protein product [Linum tenue]|uniref:Protein kinase domain-containing protein n=1 Tax=Linum tenue TaxID=586396 RepID=A0AAV0LLC3_9ROSI|nr:unnamed protein product [Linum tenue]
MTHFPLALLLTLAAAALFQTLPPAAARQNYSGLQSLNCDASDELAPSPEFLYTCNGLNRSCQSFLIFRSTPDYSSPAEIAELTSSDAAKIAQFNAAEDPSSVFDLGKDVIVPVACSCSGDGERYYRANSSFTLTRSMGTYYVVATDLFEGLATCAAIKRGNPFPDRELKPGMTIQVPQRCACPSADQVAGGVNYLLTYPISSDDSVSDLATRFNVMPETIMEANGLTLDSKLSPGTTILIPLLGLPLSSMSKVHRRASETGTPSGPEGPDRAPKSKVKALELAGLAAACFLLLLSIAVAVVSVIQRKRRKKRDAGEMRKERLKQDLRVEIASCERALKVFGIDEVNKATGNFSPGKRIKGSVYSGEFGEKVLVVKKMSREIDISQEVNILMKINHFNVINLHGVCDDGQSFYLVSEYMEFGCLKDWLKRGRKGGGGWEIRVQIGLDVANGLYYLHNFTKPAYVHQDIKTSNVLLDSNLRAKITNFSLARSAARDTNVTVHLVGTRGYMAPEYVETGEITPKIDVYAFGVVLLELITGKEAVLVVGNGKETLLSTTMVSLAEKGGLEEALASYIDPSMRETGVDVVLPLLRLSLACLRREPEARPSMEEVVSSLVKILTDLRRTKSLADDSVTDQSVTPLQRASRVENDCSVETASW